MGESIWSFNNFEENLHFDYEYHIHKTPKILKKVALGMIWIC